MDFFFHAKTLISVSLSQFYYNIDNQTYRFFCISITDHPAHRMIKQTAGIWAHFVLVNVTM
jgi:hypothetical protein